MPMKFVTRFLFDYSLKTEAVTSASGVLTLDLAVANIFTCTLTENITSILITNPPPSGEYGEFELIITQHASSAKTVAWSSTFHFPGGTDMVMSTGVGDVDRVHGITLDAGTKIHCTFVQDSS